MRKRKRLVFAMLFLPLFIFAQKAQTPYVTFSGNKGLRLMAKDSSAYLKFGLRVQPLAVVNYRDFEFFTDPELNEVQFTIRRARLKFDGFLLNPRWQYKLELALGNRNIGGISEHTSNGARIVLDAVVRYRFAKNTWLWVGQTKLPGNRERVVSSGKMQTVDRSIANGRYNIDRDLGIQVHGYYKIGEMPVNLAAAISIGEGRNITDYNTGGLEYTLRAEWLPFGAFKNKGDYVLADLEREQTHKLAFGVTFDYNDDAVRQRGNQGSYLITDDFTLYRQSLTSFMADAIWKYRGWSSLVEYFYKTAPDPILRDSTGTYKSAFYVGTGLNAQLGYVFKNNIELVGRYTFVRPEDGVDLSLGDQDQFTLGISKYISGHRIKVQGDVSYSLYEFVPDGEFQYRLQLEFGF